MPAGNSVARQRGSKEKAAEDRLTRQVRIKFALDSIRDGLSDREIIDTLRDLTGDEEINEDLIRHVQDRPGHDRRYGIDPTRIREEIGWEPQTRFEDGIKSTIRWYLDNREWTEKVVSGEYTEFYEKNYAGR